MPLLCPLVKLTIITMQHYIHLTHTHTHTHVVFSILTFTDEVLDALVEAEPMAFPPQPHVGRVIPPAALIRGAHGEQLPPAAGQQQLLLPALRAAAAAPGGPQRQALVGDVDEARVLAAAGEASAPLPVPPSVRLVPVVGAQSHRQHAQGAQREREPGVEQQLPGSHARFPVRAASAPRAHEQLSAAPAHITSGEQRRDHYLYI